MKLAASIAIKVWCAGGMALMIFFSIQAYREHHHLRVWLAQFNAAEKQRSADRAFIEEVARGLK